MLLLLVEQASCASDDDDLDERASSLYTCVYERKIRFECAIFCTFTRGWGRDVNPWEPKGREEVFMLVWRKRAAACTYISLHLRQSLNTYDTSCLFLTSTMGRVAGGADSFVSDIHRSPCDARAICPFSACSLGRASTT